MRIGTMALALALLVAAGSSHAWAERRVALVIGNDLYANFGAEEQLQRARSDASSVGDTLAGLGFEVIRAENATRQQMVDALFDLTDRIEPGDTALVYYAGHGVAIDGSNYLLPTDIPAATAGQEARIRNAAIAESSIISEAQARGARVLVIVIDACRNNPFKSAAGRSLGGERGLARMQAPRGVFGLYSAGAGQSALDRLDDADANRNSVFTRVFLDALSAPGLTLVEIAKRTQQQVEELAKRVRHEQTPGYYDQIVGDVVLNGTGARLPSSPRPEPPAADEPKPSDVVASVPLADRAQAIFVHHVLVGAAADDTALAYVQDRYADTVRYYGKVKDRRAVVRDKGSYFAKWPVRSYVPIPGATRVSCDDARLTCRVSGQTEFSVSNGAKTLAGRAAVEIEIDFRDGSGAITVEDGRLLK